MKAKEFVLENKKDRRAKKYNIKPRNPMGTAPQTGAGAHKDKKKAEKQGDVKHKGKQFDEGVAEGPNDLRDSVSEVLKTIYRGASAGENMIDYLADEFGQYYDEVEASGDQSLQNAYSYMMDNGQEAEDDPQAMAKIAKQAFFILKQDVAEGSLEEYGDTAKGQKMLTKVQKRAVDRVTSKKADTDPAYAKKNKDTADRAWDRMSNVDEASYWYGGASHKPGWSGSGRRRDPEDWDEGNTEPPNNMAIYINGKLWKVFQGNGTYADDAREMAQYRKLQDWARRKSQETGKKWEVSRTGAPATESMEEGWKEKIAATALAGSMALGAGSAGARTLGSEDPGINRLTGQPVATQVVPSTKDQSADKETVGFSTEYLKKVADGKHPRPMISVDDAKKELSKRGELKNESIDIPFNQCPNCRGPIFHESFMNEKQDACYHKVRSRYKVWPSAYASGALVQCRKKGAKNWGNKSK